MRQNRIQVGEPERNLVRFSINKKILTLSAAIVTPFLVMVVVLLAVMIRKRARRRKQQLQKQAEKTDMK